MDESSKTRRVNVFSAGLVNHPNKILVNVCQSGVILSSVELFYS